MPSRRADPDAGWEWRERDLLLALKVTPRGGRDQWKEPRDGHVAVRLQAPPVDGKANQALIAFLATEFGVPRRQVRILAGESARYKRVLIEAPARLPGFIEAGTN